MSRSSLLRVALVCLFAGGLALGGCSDGSDGADGLAGADGATGPAGADGATGPAGADGIDGIDGGNVAIAEVHGSDFLAAKDREDADKFLADLAITAVTFPTVGTEHQVTVTFSVMDGAAPITGIEAFSLGVFKLLPAAGGSASRWVPYLWRSGGTPAQNQGTRESVTTAGGVFTDNEDGTYTYTFSRTLEAMAAAALPAGADPQLDATARAFDATATHRISVATGGHSGPTGEATLDVVPNGGAVTVTRNIVQTATCIKCHGPAFSGHGGDRVTNEGCVTCHSPGTKGADGNDAAMYVMIHKIHAGRELPLAAGPDGVYFDDPATPADESADNDPYTWTSTRSTTVFEAAFPAVLANCQACHTGSGEDVDNWKTVPTRAACGSCHEDIVWAVGTNHAGGAAATDAGCAGCHPAAGGLSPITTAHDWTTKNAQNIPEFDITLTVSDPGNGTHFVAGETPVVTIVLKKDGVAIDHTTVVEDPAGEVCLDDNRDGVCDGGIVGDGLFRNANFYVTGPRARRSNVLTTGARARVTSTAETWNLTGGTLGLSFDNGKIVVLYRGTEDILVPGVMEFDLSACTLADVAAATAAEVVACLNDEAEYDYKEIPVFFSDRAVAEVAGGKVEIRSKGLGDMFAVQVTANPNPNDVVPMFDTTLHYGGTSSQVRARTNPANNDPKAVRTAANITYTLDDVDGLRPGTYVVGVEFADMGRAGAGYRTPSVATTTFQIGVAEEELPVAGNCTSCHWSSAGVGYVLDFPRHNKPFDENALDGCGSCHDYQSSIPTINSPEWGGGGKPISKRVHAVHNGSQLNYPMITVDHEEGAGNEGRNWDITYPMDIRNCESCHPDGEVSGSWLTNPNRLACSGCHDTAAATAHMKSMTVDPTPLSPFSGDEEEACAVCH